MKTARLFIFSALFALGILYVLFLTGRGASLLFAADVHQEKGHAHSGGKPSKSDASKTADTKDAHKHERADEHAADRHGHDDEHAYGKEDSAHRNDECKEVQKDDYAHEKEKARSDHAHKKPKQKADKHGHGHEAGEQEEEQVVRLSEEEMRRYGVEVSTAAHGSLESQINLPGEVSLNEDSLTHIVPRMPGVVKQVRKTIGDFVKQGEIMAVIDSRELADAKAEYLASLEKVELAKAKFNREERLWKKKISSEEEYLDAKQGLAEVRIALRSSEQKLHALGFAHQYLKDLPKQSDLSFTHYEITAPFNATVIQKHISPGEMLKEDTEAFVIADLSTVWVNLNVYQKDVPKIRKGQPVLISFGEGGEATQGKIAYVEPIIKTETRTALARVILPNPQGRWSPGMFVTAKVLIGDDKAAIVVPPAAVQELGDRKVVFVLNDEGFEPRPIKVGRSTEDGVEISSGLFAGERYAGSGTLTLKAQLSKEEFGGHSH